MYVVKGLLFRSVHMLTCWYIFIVVLGWGWGSAPCELQRFWLFLKKLKLRTHGWMQNWILWHIKKKVFQCFELFRARLAYKFAKTDNMTPTNFFPNIFNMDIKKCRIWCRFQTIEKVSRMFTQRKLECWELMYSVLKDEKVHNFYMFMLITFCLPTS